MSDLATNVPAIAKERDYFLDNAKFVLILLVVTAHLLMHVPLPITSLVRDMIYSFHMACFVLISGYLSQLQKVQKILPLFGSLLAFQVIEGFIRYFLFDSGRAPNLIYPEKFLWYLVAMIIWKLLLPYITRLKHPVVITVILALLVGYDQNIGGAFAASRAIAMFPFFCWDITQARTSMAKSNPFHLGQVRRCLSPVSSFSTFRIPLSPSSSSLSSRSLTLLWA